MADPILNRHSREDGKPDSTSSEKLITQHIDIWTTAIKQKSSAGRGSSNKYSLYGIKKLRELILELAVRGKLVPQDVNDEPALILLERIDAEKAQLVKEGKLKIQKPLPQISEDEKPFELPQGWEWCRLIDIASYINGFAFKSSSFKDTGVGIVKIGDISFNGELTPETMSRVDKSVIENLDQNLKVEAGDLVIAMSGATTGKLGFNKSNEVFYLNQRVGKFVSYQVNIHYLYLPLTTKIAENLAKSTGSAIPNLSTGQINEIVFALPPLEEQHRIVAKVDELMSLCDALEAQTEASITAHQTLVETLLNALLLPNITQQKDSQSASPESSFADSREPALNDSFIDSWQRVAEHFDTLFTTAASIDTLKQTILQLAVMGKLVPWSKDAQENELKKYLSFGPRNGFSPKEVPTVTDVSVLKLGATTYGYLDLNQTKYVDIKVEGDSHLWLREGDILIQRGNSANYVGCNCLVKMDVEGVIYPDLMMKLRTVEHLSPEFLSIWLSSPKSRQFMWDRMTGTSGTMPKISKKIVESIPIIIPSIAVQALIVARVDELMTLCDQLKARLSDAQTTQLHLTDAIVEQVG
jgi:type I restriction enzyme S subunit